MKTESALNELINFAEGLRQNKIGIFPCDTIWGLVGLIRPSVIEKIFQLKARNSSSPLLILIPNLEFLSDCVIDVSEKNSELISKLWPGPYTLIFKKNPKIPDSLTGGRPTIGIRYPNFKPLNDLLNFLKEPLISTSVNMSGDAYMKTLDECPAEIKSEVSLIFDKTIPGLNQESTVIDCTQEVPKILRAWANSANLNF